MALTPNRVESSANWTTQNTILAKGEVGFAFDTGIYKVGDGVRGWNTLPVADFSLTQGSPFGNFTITGLLVESFQSNITAYAGGGQTNAFQLTCEVNLITTVATAGDSVKLPAAIKGLTIVVVNKGANPMTVFGAGTDIIDDNASATGVTQMQFSEVIYSCATDGKWYANGLGTGFAGAFPTLGSTDNITASATQTQIAGTPLTTPLNRVVTVASPGNAVTLPASKNGMVITVTDAHATNSIQVFPASGDSINALGANAAFSVAATKTVQFVCNSAGQWHTLLSA